MLNTFPPRNQPPDPTSLKGFYLFFPFPQIKLRVQRLKVQNQLMDWYPKFESTVVDKAMSSFVQSQLMPLLEPIISMIQSMHKAPMQGELAEDHMDAR